MEVQVAHGCAFATSTFLGASILVHSIPDEKLVLRNPTAVIGNYMIRAKTARRKKNIKLALELEAEGERLLKVLHNQPFH